MCRIIGLGPFCGTSGKDWERESAREIANAKKQVKGQGHEEIIKDFEEALQNSQRELKPEEKQVAVTTYKLVKNFQRVIGDNMIRRTTKSRRPDGQPLNPDLPDYIAHTYSVMLTAGEYAILSEDLESMKETHRKLSCADFTWTVRALFFLSIPPCSTPPQSELLDAVSDPGRMSESQRNEVVRTLGRGLADL